MSRQAKFTNLRVEQNSSSSVRKLPRTSQTLNSVSDSSDESSWSDGGAVRVVLREVAETFDIFRILANHFNATKRSIVCYTTRH